jgi:hypothetical protein
MKCVLVNENGDTAKRLSRHVIVHQQCHGAQRANRGVVKGQQATWAKQRHSSYWTFLADNTSADEAHDRSHRSDAA